MFRGIFRSFKSHVLDQGTMSRGRSVNVSGKSVGKAYSQLRNVLNESRVREIVRYQTFFERKHDKKRRLKKELLLRQYLSFTRKNIERANDLKVKTSMERSNFEPI